MTTVVNRGTVIDQGAEWRVFSLNKATKKLEPAPMTVMLDKGCLLISTENKDYSGKTINSRYLQFYRMRKWQRDQVSNASERICHLLNLTNDWQIRTQSL